MKLLLILMLIHQAPHNSRPQFDEIYYFDQAYGDGTFSIVRSHDTYTGLWAGVSEVLTPCSLEYVCLSAPGFALSVPADGHEPGYEWSAADHIFRIDQVDTTYCDGRPPTTQYTISLFRSAEAHQNGRADARYEYSFSCGLLVYSGFLRGEEFIYTISPRGFLVKE